MTLIAQEENEEGLPRQIQLLRGKGYPRIPTLLTSL